jgi:SPP1 family predicted phage head-tail adaptor
MVDRTHVRSGQLRHRVTLEHRADGSQGPLGDLVEQWTALASNVPANLDYLDGHKLLAAKQVHAEATVRVEIRYYSSFTPNCRITTSDGKQLYPVSVVPDHKNRHMIILCRERL